MKLEMCSPCLFGLEGPLASELKRMGMENVRAENGRVCFSGSERDLAKANLRLRFGERVLIELGSFPARTFDELFEGVKALSWERFIPRNGAFPVKGHCLDSKLSSVPSCQKIVKKAVVDRLSEWYDISWFREDGDNYQIQFSIMKDTAYLYLDSSGVGLHKRGYRPAHLTAPLRETLASAMVDLARYHGRGELCDPFCGSGTIAIEAALAAKGRAPGISRSFSAEKWRCFDPAIWQEAREEARAREFSGTYRIYASDIDPEAIEIARKNASRAGVEDIIEFSVADAAGFDRRTDDGVIVTNPPYGERLMEKQSAEELYRRFGSALRALGDGDGWRKYILSSHTEFERGFGRPADKKRKLYNGMLKCDLFMYGVK